jgi:hypothetical protein
VPVELVVPARQPCLASLPAEREDALAEADRQDVEGRAQGPAALARLGHELSCRASTQRPLHSPSSGKPPTP